MYTSPLSTIVGKGQTNLGQLYFSRLSLAMPAKLNFFKTPASVRLVSSRTVSTSTGISGCYQPHRQTAMPGQKSIYETFLLRCLPLGSKLFQEIATMTYTRSHTRPSQKDLGCVVSPLNNKSLLCTSHSFLPRRVWLSYLIVQGCD